jgi:hypothetical protein
VGLMVIKPRTTASTTASKIPRTLDPALVDQGISFYMNKFIIGQPDQAMTPIEIQANPVVWHPLVQEMMAAIGLAGLSNLRGDESINVVAREKYGSALARTMTTMTTSDATQAHAVMRTVIMLAVFEVVKGSHEANSGAMAHIRGAAAFAHKFLAKSTAPTLAVRGLLQLINTMFIPCQVAGVPLPSIFYESIALSNFKVGQYDPYDRPAKELTVTISRYVHLSAYVRRHTLGDGQKQTSLVIQQALQLDAQLEMWERSQEGKWRFGLLSGHPDLPTDAVFQGQLHTYTDQWIARVWNHYRWARILVNELLLDFVQRCPESSLPLISAAQQARCLHVTRRLVEDLLVSLPTHWRHPSLSEAQRRIIQETSGGAGVGAAGIPSLLHQLKVAACAPAVPLEHWQWALGIMDAVWSEMGMLQARSLGEVMRAHRDKVKLEQPEGILRRAPHYKWEQALA